MDQDSDESVPLQKASHINENRRRRTRRLIVPSGRTERALYVNEIAKRLVPGLDFYAFTALCSLVLCAAILLDHPAIYILAALIAPFMAPLVGLGLSTAVGSFRFFIRSLGSLLIGSAFIFFGGMVSGWISRLLPNFTGGQAIFHTTFSISHLILLLVGSILAIYLTVRVPKQRSLVASVALAYEVYLPIGVAGFGLTSKFGHFFGPALRLVGINILLVIVIGAIVLAFLRLRPFTMFGYLLTALLLGGSVYALIASSALKTTLQPPASPVVFTMTLRPTDQGTVVLTKTPLPPTATIPMVVGELTATNTLVPTHTPTLTITPKPADIWAVINNPTGVWIREQPCYDDTKCPKVIPAVQFNTPVKVLTTITNVDGTWVQILVPEDNRQGWIANSYLTYDSQ